jgi:hypothetical protein
MTNTTKPERASPLFMWANEDALPEDMDGQVYDFLYPVSELIDGCRMFPWPVVRRNQLQYQPDARYNPIATSPATSEGKQ